MKLKLIVELLLSKEKSIDNVKYRLVKEVDNVSDIYLGSGYLEDSDEYPITLDVAIEVEKVLHRQIKSLFNNDDIVLNWTDLAIKVLTNNDYNEDNNTLYVDALFFIKLKTDTSKNKEELERVYYELRDTINSVLNETIDQCLLKLNKE